MADENHDVAIGDILAAMLSEQHALSAEDLQTFESLCDGPDVDDATRREYLQIIWNIVVGIIDHKWSVAANSSARACGQKLKKDNGDEIGTNDMLQLEDRKLSKTYKHAAGKNRLSRGAA